MSLEKITTVSGTGVYVPGSDIDTDRIIPARFMKCVTFDGLGEYAFYDVRHDSDDNKLDHPLNDARFTGASVLLSGVNFGCGSSREHAPQALYRFGFRALIAESFAEIFFGNSTTLGIPCVTASAEDIKTLAAAIDTDPKIEVTIDLDKGLATYGENSVPISIPATAHDALTNGKWDPIAELIEGAPDVEKTAGALDYMAR
ncbi:MAG: 3-isopropylmalate dehydratase small subunit [Verrucomicrobiales bacterium]|nr:3-isopropylmalate dehydratase small subunit [Verrucomicrobiales bacterium]